MARSKMPAFAVCGGVSVETVVTGVGRRRSSGKTTTKSAVAGLADSLYADLLWDCGGANVENITAAVGTASSMQALPNEDFSDVFGGPPKFASISSQLSVRKGLTKISDSCSSEVILLESSANTLTGFDVIGLSPLRIVQKRLENPPATCSPVMSVKVSEGDNECSLQHKGDFANSGKEFSSAVRSGASSCLNTLASQGAASDVVDDAKTSGLSISSRKDFTGMKENIEDFFKVCGSEEEDKLVNDHEKTELSVSKGSQGRKQNVGRHVQHDKLRRQNHNIIIKKDSFEELWVTINDVKCATEPSRFPPPTRPPPELKYSDAYIFKNMDGVASSINERRNSPGLTLPRQSIAYSGSLSSSFTRELNTKATYASRGIKDAVEIAEEKIKMVLEAREKAKSMVQGKLKEKRRAQQLKERRARESQPGGEGASKGHKKYQKGEKENSRVQCSKLDVNGREVERCRQMDIARRCIEKVNRELQNQSASSVHERVAELRFSHDSEEPEIRKECHTESIDRSTVDIETTSGVGSVWLDTSVGYQKQSSCENRSERVGEGAINVPREQQQGVSSSSFSLGQKEYDKFSSLNEFDSISSTHTTVTSLHDKSAVLLHDFPEIMGETLERRMARWDRYCCTAARMSRALEQKKQRDLERQEEQTERHRAAETVDEDIKVWAAGKEGNLEALLCSLHLVLWPECGWTVVSPADLSTTASVKKIYRRATLCVHPDKVQQRGATIAQKYIAEKVFDLLREALAVYE